MKRRSKCIELAKLFMHDMPRTVKVLLYISLATWALHGYKQIESVIHPVVVDFTIKAVEEVAEGKRIAGHMDKVRDCKFEEVLAYSNNKLVDIKFVDVRNVVSRVEGKQAWGWWLVIPAVDTLTLYSRHTCVTGSVLTKLYEGEI